MSTIANRRPLTGHFSAAQLDMVRLCRPIHAEEHLVQAWDALSEACRGVNEVRNVDFAKTRLEHARAVVAPWEEHWPSWATFDCDVM